MCARIDLNSDYVTVDIVNSRGNLEKKHPLKESNRLIANTKNKVSLEKLFAASIEEANSVLLRSQYRPDDTDFIWMQVHLGLYQAELRH